MKFGHSRDQTGAAGKKDIKWKDIGPRYKIDGGIDKDRVPLGQNQ